MAAYFRSVMNNSVSNTVIIEFSKRNESYRNWLDLLLLVTVHCTVRQYYFNNCNFRKNSLIRSLMMIM